MLAAHKFVQHLGAFKLPMQLVKNRNFNNLAPALVKTFWEFFGTLYQRKTTGQQPKGKIVSAPFHTFWQFLALFRTFSRFFRVFQKFSSRTFP